ncbi:MAG: hypothetical protein O9340_13680 [Cyclobacteriaceae bacterium]|jgi:hypothetical protein|nr:hypothetical protein [Cyclobacteriaceae bacterium]
MIKLLAIKHIELRYFLTVLFIFVALQGIVYAQLPQKKAVYKGFPSLVWPKLYDITYIKEAEDFGGLDKPIFSDAAKSLQGKEITVPGYMVPFDNGAMTANHFMLSSLPINVCFFCGGGGPETVIEVFSVQPVRFTDKPVEVKGKLFLNDKNPEQMLYLLTSSTLLGEIEF